MNQARRPTKLISQNKEISYSYDVHDNIKTKTETPIDKQGNEIAQSQNGLIGYRKSIQFAYNPNNELKQTITIIDTGLEVTKTTTSYHYDAFGRRIAKNSKTQTLNKLNQNGKLVKYPTTLLHLRKTDKTQHQTTLMLWDGNRQIQEYTDDFVFTTVYDDQSFEPVSRIIQSRDKTCDEFKIYHYHNNHLGTPQELTDDDGNVVWANYEYAWGGTYQSYYKEQSLNDITIKDYELQPIKFQGQSLDIETGLHYNRFRYYDSDVGMFISRDPIGLLGGNNVFAYAPNPIGWVDPWGLAKNNGNVKTGAGRDHVTYRGFRNGKSYTGYASAPSHLGLTPDQIISRRYGGDFKAFGGQAPTPVYNGSGVQGKRTARGLEQHYFEQDVKNLGRKNVDNAQNPVGPNNSNRDKYKKAAEEHLNPKPTNGKKVKCVI